MPLLIDCYNVLHADIPPALAGLGEASLCALLRRSPWASGGVVVVCDGSPKPHSPDVHAVEPVELIFSGQGRSADDVIIKRIDEDSAPKRLTVVSSDRAIRRAARRRRARDWSSEAFLSRLVKVATQGGNRSDADPSAGEGLPGAGTGKPSAGSITDHHVQHWLEKFGITDEPAPPGEKPYHDPFKDPWKDVEGIEGPEDLEDLMDK